MSFDRPVSDPPQIANFKNQPTQIGSAQLEEANLGILFDQFEMNRQELEENISKLLQNNAQVSLAELVKTYPIQNGLAEVLTYFSIATSSKQHLVNGENQEAIPWLVEEEVEVPVKKEIFLPQVIFIRNPQLATRNS